MRKPLHTRLLKVTKSWDVITESTNDLYPKPASRMPVFKKWPHAKMVRRPPQRGVKERMPFRIQCEEAGCKFIIYPERAFEYNSIKCEIHRRVTILGATTSAPHLIALKSKITKVIRCKSGRSHFYINCRNKCGRMTEVTQVGSASREYCKKCTYLSGTRFKDFDPKLGYNPFVVAYGLLDNRGSPARRAMARCNGPDCDALVIYENRRKIRGKFFCKPCTGQLRKKLPHQNRYNILVRSAKKRGIPLSFGLKWYAELLEYSRCYYCNYDISILPHAKKSTKYAVGGSFLDRTDNTKGYTKANVVVCCPPCNLSKGRFNLKEETQIIGAARQGNINAAIEMLKEHEAKIVRHNQRLHAEKNIWLLLAKPSKLSR